MRRLHLTRSCASSPDKSFLKLSNHLCFGLPLLPIFSPAIPSPSLSCPHILLLFSIQRVHALQLFMFYMHFFVLHYEHFNVIALYKLKYYYYLCRQRRQTKSVWTTSDAPWRGHQRDDVERREGVVVWLPLGYKATEYSVLPVEHLPSVCQLLRLGQQWSRQNEDRRKSAAIYQGVYHVLALGVIQVLRNARR